MNTDFKHIFPHKVVQTIDSYWDLLVSITWCELNIGPPWRKSTPDNNWIMIEVGEDEDEYVWYFRHESDAVMFALSCI